MKAGLWAGQTSCTNPWKNPVCKVAAWAGILLVKTPGSPSCLQKWNGECDHMGTVCAVHVGWAAGVLGPHPKPAAPETPAVSAFTSPPHASHAPSALRTLPLRHSFLVGCYCPQQASIHSWGTTTTKNPYMLQWCGALQSPTLPNKVLLLSM